MTFNEILEQRYCKVCKHLYSDNRAMSDIYLKNCRYPSCRINGYPCFEHKLPHVIGMSPAEFIYCYHKVNEFNEFEFIKEKEMML